MRYDEALRLWGAARMDEWKAEQNARTERQPWSRGELFTKTDPDEVAVSFQMQSHYSDSNALEPRVHIYDGGSGYYTEVPGEKFDLHAFLREVVEAAGGTITFDPEHRLG